MSEIRDDSTSSTLSPAHFAPGNWLDGGPLQRSVGQWNEHLENFDALIANAPGVRDALRTTLREQLNTDPELTGLLFEPDGSRTFINLIGSVSFFVCGPVTACRQAGLDFTRLA